MTSLKDRNEIIDMAQLPEPGAPPFRCELVCICGWHTGLRQSIESAQVAYEEHLASDASHKTYSREPFKTSIGKMTHVDIRNIKEYLDSAESMTDVDDFIDALGLAYERLHGLYHYFRAFQ